MQKNMTFYFLLSCCTRFLEHCWKPYTNPSTQNSRNQTSAASHALFVLQISGSVTCQRISNSPRFIANEFQGQCSAVRKPSVV